MTNKRDSFLFDVLVRGAQDAVGDFTKLNKAQKEVAEEAQKSAKKFNDAQKSMASGSTNNVIQAVDNMTATMKKLNPELVAEAEAARKAGSGTQVLGKESQDAAPKVNNLGKALATAAKAAVTAFVAYKALGILKGVIGDTAKLGTEVFTLQQELGGTAEDVSKLIFVFKQFGIEPAKLATTMGIFSRNLALVEQNAAGLNTRGQQSTRVFSALGITVLDANGKLLPTITILEELADKFAASTDGALKAGVAEQFFGQNSVDLIPILNLGSAGIEELVKQAERLGVVFTDKGALAAFQFTQSQRELEQAFLGLKVAIGNELLPVLTKFTRDFTTFISENKDSIAKFAKDAVIEIGNFVEGLKTAFEILKKGLSFLPEHETQIVASVTAIGIALVLAFGPHSAALAGLVLIIANLERIEKLGNSVADSINKKLGLPSSSRGTDKVAKLSTEEILGPNGAQLLKEAGAPAFHIQEIIESVRRASEELAKQKAEEDKLADSTKKTGLELDGLTEAQRRAITETQRLAQAFVDSSLAAGQVEDLTAALGLFGEVSFELAQNIGLSAEAAGNVQGFNAVTASLQRADQRAFNFTKTLATIAQVANEAAAGVRGAATALRELIQAIAQSALDALQAAVSAVAGGITREVANQNVKAAQQNLKNAQTAAKVNPQTEALQKQLDAVNKAIDAANKAASAQNKEIDKQNKAAREAAKAQDKANKAIVNAAKDQIRQMELANTIAEVAADRQIAALERLIMATQKQASELQEAFLKSNEDLQRQINEAIGRGDMGTALGLVDQQRTASKAYQEQAKALQKNVQELTFQQRLLKLEEEERQRSARLALAFARAQQDAIEASVAATDAEIENTEHVEANTESLETQKQSIEDQIASLTAQTDAGDAAAARIAEQTAIYEAQTAVLEAQAVAANKALLSQSEQRAELIKLTGQVGIASGALRDLSGGLVENLIPAVKTANEQYDILVGAMKVLADEGFRQTLIDKGIDPATVSLMLHARAAESAADAERRLALDAVSAGRTNVNAAQNNFRASVAVLNKILSWVNIALPTSPPAGGVIPMAEGGLFNRPTSVIISEKFQKEAIIPLEKPARAREILTSLPSAVLASILPKSQGGAVFAPNITVTGNTLDSMEAAALRAVRAAFRDARTSSSRAGGLITQGIGPSR